MTIALTGQVDFDGDAAPVAGGAVAIAPDAPHAFQGTGLVAHLFVAPESQAGRAIIRGLFANGPMASIAAHQLGDFPARLRATFADPRHTEDDLRALGRGLISLLADGCSPAEASDPRIVRLIAWVTTRLDRAVSLRDASKLIHLSPGRTRHLFVQQTGLPFRTYLLWMRLVRAVEMFAGGASLTESSHGAGFADSAHFSRTFRRMFGIAAATLRLS